MPAPSSFDYAVFRIVPRVDREEFLNAGVILFCLSRSFLKARVHLDKPRLTAFAPGVDISLVRQHLEALPKICAGDDDAGPIAKLPIRQRFHWLVAPRSTIIQVSPVHSGLSDAPDQTLDELFRRLVLL